MKKEPEPDVEIADEEELETPGAVSQVVPDDMETEKPVVKQEEKKIETPKPQPQVPSPEISKLNNTIAYQTRQLERAMKELAEVRQQMAKPQNLPRPEGVQPDEIDEIAQKDWKLGVKRVVEKDIEAKVQELFQKREEAQAELNRRNAAESELDKSKKRVIERYPNIEDTSTEESKLYLEVINEDNSLLRNIHGPEIAMYRMEERMKQRGIVPPSVRPVVDREAQRLARVGASSVIGRTNGTKTFDLTMEQKEFCKHHNISQDVYKKHLKNNFRDGVEV